MQTLAMGSSNSLTLSEEISKETKKYKEIVHCQLNPTEADY